MIGGGPTGGSVAGGSVGGGSVGGGGLVGGGLVAGTEVGAEVGRLELDSLGSASLFRGVEEISGVFVGVSVRVTVGVGEGNVEVMVGISEAVAVGTVAVGKGSSSAAAVIAIAVFVLLALLWLSALPRMGFPKMMAYTGRIRPRHKMICTRIWRGIRFFPKNFKFTRSVLLSYTFRKAVEKAAIISYLFLCHEKRLLFANAHFEQESTSPDFEAQLLGRRLYNSPGFVRVLSVAPLLAGPRPVDLSRVDRWQADRSVLDPSVVAVGSVDL